ncbi:hypothetical protein AB0M46_24295 [Dactylosporangium sp. NPDC051485]|uniref:hypothetical protein n=1 Tax=Dactylosporangium sp. NPDC051485 TaxID=3154846 RepID=UPI00341B550E
MAFSHCTPRCKRYAFAFMLGLGLLHNAAGDRLLPNLPRAVEPIVGRDWDRQEAAHSTEPDTAVVEAGQGGGATGAAPPPLVVSQQPHRRYWSGYAAIIANNRARSYGAPA